MKDNLVFAQFTGGYDCNAWLDSTLDFETLVAYCIEVMKKHTDVVTRKPNQDVLVDIDMSVTPEFFMSKVSAEICCPQKIIMSNGFIIRDGRRIEEPKFKPRNAVGNLNGYIQGKGILVGEFRLDEMQSEEFVEKLTYMKKYTGLTCTNEEYIRDKNGYVIGCRVWVCKNSDLVEFGGM